jgi:hypothetical protein
MTKYNETGHGFWLFPPEQWKDIAKAYRENIKALREYIDKLLALECRTCEEGIKAKNATDFGVLHFEAPRKTVSLQAKKKYSKI